MCSLAWVAAEGLVAVPLQAGVVSYSALAQEDFLEK